jgi:hypothetical protein
MGAKAEYPPHPHASKAARLQAAPRCKAYGRRKKVQCGGPAMRGKRVCRMHGAKGGAPKGERNGAYRTGYYTAEAKAYRREYRDLMRQLRVVMSELEGQ